MNNATNYHPSCIKIPATGSRQNNAMACQKLDLNEVFALNRELIALANRAFGEGKWSHSITNQTIDFAELFMGKYICGCATFVKIQLHNGIYHEDMAYHNAEGTTKGLAIHSARIVSLTEAFKKVLTCFNYFIEHDIEKLLTKSSNTCANNMQVENLECSLSGFNSDMFESCPQASSSSNQNQNVVENVPGVMTKSKSLYNQEEQSAVSKLETKSKSLTPVASKCNVTSTNNAKALTDEELLRMERKRRQLEKQNEFKRLMQEKKLQEMKQQEKLGNLKPNPKY
ncbi:uncharacterized protein LOC144469306 [Augochlora pura]